MTKLEITPNPTPYMVLAPAGAKVPTDFDRRIVCDDRYEMMLARMQVMRGRIAVAEGAIQKEQLDFDKRYWMPRDEHSWHLLRLGASCSLAGCSRILERPHRPRSAYLRL